MKKFNKITELQMAKANGGGYYVLASISTVFGALGTTVVVTSVTTNNGKKA